MRPCRSGSVPRYKDHHHFTRLNTEKKEISLREEMSGIRERVKRPCVVMPRDKEFQTLNEREDYRQDDSNSAHRENTGVWKYYPQGGSKPQAIFAFHSPYTEHSSATWPSREQSWANHSSARSSTGTTRHRLSRGLWAKSRRRNLPSRISREALSIIPESRDESEDYITTIISESQIFVSSSDLQAERSVNLYTLPGSSC